MGAPCQQAGLDLAVDFWITCYPWNVMTCNNKWVEFSNLAWILSEVRERHLCAFEPFPGGQWRGGNSHRQAHTNPHNRTLFADFQQGQQDFLGCSQWFGFMCSCLQGSHPVVFLFTLHGTVPLRPTSLEDGPSGSKPFIRDFFTWGFS